MYLVTKNYQLRFANSIAAIPWLKVQVSDSFPDGKGYMKKTETKKDGAIKGPRRSGADPHVQPQQPEPNSDHSRSYKGTKCGLVQRPEEVALQRPWVLETIDRNSQTWWQAPEEKSAAESVRDEVEEIVEAAGEIIDRTSAMLAKKLEDIALHWRWITVAATAMAIAVGCVAVVFFCPQYTLCLLRCSVVRCRHMKRRTMESTSREAEILRNSRDFEPIWIPPANIEGRGSVAIRESYRNDSLNVLTTKNYQLRFANSIAAIRWLKVQVSDSFPAGKGYMRKTETKKDGAIKGPRRSGAAPHVQPQQPEPNSDHSRSYKGTKCGLVQRPEEVALQRPVYSTFAI
ncbi:hypothetical protein Tcan_08638 [Toxocara canis]|uniref:Uncharacterized protein n=1 Tax=Toxocara canis TaxID=6265 RepID=A0A0B2W264_TOXCA|nr:hypothetical protein Tcan_08638 [Toxocara canis]